MTAQARELVHSDIKPDNPPERAAHYLDIPNMPWEKTKFPGIAIKVLYADDTGITTALFKLDPGAVVPLHEHTALEQTLCHRRLARGSRGKVRTGSIRLATGWQSTRGRGPERRCPARLLPEAQSLCLWRQVLHGAGREVEANRNPGCICIMANSAARLPLRVIFDISSVR